MKRITGVLVLLMLVLVPLQALGSMPFVKLGLDTNLVCTYPGQTFGYWNGGIIQTGTIESQGDDEPMKIQISTIDRIKGTAMFKNAWDEYEIAILRVLTNLTFLDMDPIQGIRVITVYPHFCPDRKAYCSVISEHAGPAGRVAPAQMFGFCEVK